MLTQNVINLLTQNAKTRNVKTLKLQLFHIWQNNVLIIQTAVSFQSPTISSQLAHVGLQRGGVFIKPTRANGWNCCSTKLYWPYSKRAGDWIRVFNIDGKSISSLKIIRKSVQKLVNLSNLRVIGLNAKVWYTFKNR